jgi:hypothetical protein
MCYCSKPKRMIKKKTYVFSTSSAAFGTKTFCINFKESGEFINMIEEEG